MTTSIFDRLVDNFLSALGASGAPVEDHPSGDPDVEAEGEVLAVEAGDLQVLEREAGVTRWSQDFEVEGYVVGNDGAATRSKRNDLLSRAHNALLTDYTMGGLAELVLAQSVAFATVRLGDVRCLGFTALFTVQFTTRSTDSTAQ